MPSQNINKELISVVLCSYNGEAYLSQQLKTIQEQTYQNIEIVIVDDCSTDESYAIAETAAQKDDRIRCFRQERNVGYNKNFLSAFEKARGNFVSIADQDDIWELDKLEYMMVHLWESPEVKMVHTKSARFADGERPLIKQAHLYRSFKGNDLRKLFLFNPVSGHNMIFKKELLPDIALLPEGLYFDWWINIVAASNGLINASEKVSTYQRVHSGNATAGAHNRILLQTQLLEVLPLILSYKGLLTEQRKFGITLLEKMRGSQKSKLNLPLLFFLLKNSAIFFYAKRRLFPYFSYLKMSYKISKGRWVV